MQLAVFPYKAYKNASNEGCRNGLILYTIYTRGVVTKKVCDTGVNHPPDTVFDVHFSTILTPSRAKMEGYKAPQSPQNPLFDPHFPLFSIQKRGVLDPKMTPKRAFLVQISGFPEKRGYFDPHFHRFS